MEIHIHETMKAGPVEFRDDGEGNRFIAVQLDEFLIGEGTPSNVGFFAMPNYAEAVRFHNQLGTAIDEWQRVVKDENNRCSNDTKTETG